MGYQVGGQKIWLGQWMRNLHFSCFGQADPDSRSPPKSPIFFSSFLFFFFFLSFFLSPLSVSFLFNFYFYFVGAKQQPKTIEKGTISYLIMHPRCAKFDKRDKEVILPLSILGKRVILSTWKDLSR